jgi:hypothetical protein
VTSQVTARPPLAARPGTYTVHLVGQGLADDGITPVPGNVVEVTSAAAVSGTLDVPFASSVASLTAGASNQANLLQVNFRVPTATVTLRMSDATGSFGEQTIAGLQTSITHGGGVYACSYTGSMDVLNEALRQVPINLDAGVTGQATISYMVDTGIEQKAGEITIIPSVNPDAFKPQEIPYFNTEKILSIAGGLPSGLITAFLIYLKTKNFVHKQIKLPKAKDRAELVLSKLKAVRHELHPEPATDTAVATRKALSIRRRIEQLDEAIYKDQRVVGFANGKLTVAADEEDPVNETASARALATTAGGTVSTAAAALPSASTQDHITSALDELDSLMIELACEYGKFTSPSTEWGVLGFIKKHAETLKSHLVNPTIPSDKILLRARFLLQLLNIILLTEAVNERPIAIMPKVEIYRLLDNLMPKKQSKTMSDKLTATMQDAAAEEFDEESLEHIANPKVKRQITCLVKAAREAMAGALDDDIWYKNLATGRAIAPSLWYFDMLLVDSLAPNIIAQAERRATMASVSASTDSSTDKKVDALAEIEKILAKTVREDLQRWQLINAALEALLKVAENSELRTKAVAGQQPYKALLTRVEKIITDQVNYLSSRPITSSTMWPVLAAKEQKAREIVAEAKARLDALAKPASERPKSARNKFKTAGSKLAAAGFMRPSSGAIKTDEEGNIAGYVSNPLHQSSIVVADKAAATQQVRAWYLAWVCCCCRTRAKTPLSQEPAVVVHNSPLHKAHVATAPGTDPRPMVGSPGRNSPPRATLSGLLSAMPLPPPVVGGVGREPEPVVSDSKQVPASATLVRVPGNAERVERVAFPDTSVATISPLLAARGNGSDRSTSSSEPEDRARSCAVVVRGSGLNRGVHQPRPGSQTGLDAEV